ncbi:hypothetical protein BS17DRAFT_767172 [Gyrodon lividus]|nr:hypothetical protein BS17DRAFT_767172 [Gyrodon lividus]
MQKHAKKCWGDEALKAADLAKNATEVHENIVGSILRTGSIMQAFEWKSQGKLVFARTRVRVAKMNVEGAVSDCVLGHHAQVTHQEYDGKLNFTMDGWTAPNHCALFGPSAPQGEELAMVFQQVLRKFMIDDKMLCITCNNASNNTVMVEKLGEMLNFSGASMHTQCFLHTTNLVVKVLLREFDVKSKGQSKDGEVVADEDLSVNEVRLVRELDKLSQDIEYEDAVTMTERDLTDKEQNDDTDGLVNKISC